jgi:hypothetical protein
MLEGAENQRALRRERGCNTLEDRPLAGQEFNMTIRQLDARQAQGQPLGAVNLLVR